ncbi:hypothetical protein [Nostoc sp. NZL]|uniref:hypothetical protein n=1 Tax=Nostoc sp. NZL TaxID=2650612 RepID=UPI0018C5AC1A|nr:hypothetical protein [Nostoc sp. NZL]MBG1243538.1 hypothetical protein [Nostoc sp. NZL]
MIFDSGLVPAWRDRGHNSEQLALIRKPPPRSLQDFYGTTSCNAFRINPTISLLVWGKVTRLGVKVNSTKRQGEGGREQGEMTPDSCRGAERNMFLRPPLLLSGSRSGGVESPS